MEKIKYSFRTRFKSEWQLASTTQNNLGLMFCHTSLVVLRDRKMKNTDITLCDHCNLPHNDPRDNFSI